MTPPDVEGLLRELAPQALGAVARRYGEFADAEDAVQEALVTAAVQWPAGLPDRPLSWLITVASRRLVDEYRRTDARRRREELAASLSIHQEEIVPSSDDSLVMLFLCCDDTLSSTLSIPLTLRAVAGLTTRQIAAAYLVPEATMAQRISRAKAKLRGRRFELPADPAARLRSVCQVLYLLFNEGYTSSSGPDLSRVDLSGEAIRLARMLHGQAPDDPEVAGLLALMLLTEARRPARASAEGALGWLVANEVFWGRQKRWGDPAPKPRVNMPKESDLPPLRCPILPLFRGCSPPSGTERVRPPKDTSLLGPCRSRTWLVAQLAQRPGGGAQREIRQWHQRQQISPGVGYRREDRGPDDPGQGGDPHRRGPDQQQCGHRICGHGNFLGADLTASPHGGHPN